MKTFIITLIISFSVFSSSIFAQCGEILVERGKEKLAGTSIIKDYRILLKKGNKHKPPYATYKIKLKANTVYRIVSETDIKNKNPLIIKLSDDYSVLGESFNKETNENSSIFDFLCPKTQNYYLTAYYKNATQGCGVVFLSKVKTYSNY